MAGKLRIAPPPHRQLEAFRCSYYKVQSMR
jgi:hypothetical protein